jgi:hypothetical protein
MDVKHNLRTVRVTTVAMKKSVSIIYSECVPVALSYLSGMQIAFLRRFVLSSVTCVDLPCFSTLCH